MTPTLIVLMLAVAAAALIVLARRRKPTRSERAETDTAWNDPVTPTPDDKTEPSHDGPRR